MQRHHAGGELSKARFSIGKKYHFARCGCSNVLMPVEASERFATGDMSTNYGRGASRFAGTTGANLKFRLAVNFFFLGWSPSLVVGSLFTQCEADIIGIGCTKCWCALGCCCNAPLLGSIVLATAWKLELSLHYELGALYIQVQTVVFQIEGIHPQEVPNIIHLNPSFTSIRH